MLQVASFLEIIITCLQKNNCSVATHHALLIFVMSLMVYTALIWSILWSIYGPQYYILRYKRERDCAQMLPANKMNPCTWILKAIIVLPVDLWCDSDYFNFFYLIRYWKNMKTLEKKLIFFKILLKYKNKNALDYWQPSNYVHLWERWLNLQGLINCFKSISAEILHHWNLIGVCSHGWE